MHCTHFPTVSPCFLGTALGHLRFYVHPRHLTYRYHLKHCHIFSREQITFSKAIILGIHLRLREYYNSCQTCRSRRALTGEVSACTWQVHDGGQVGSRSLPIPSMYGILTYIYHRNQPNVGIYNTIHGWYGLLCRFEPPMLDSMLSLFRVAFH